MRLCCRLFPDAVGAVIAVITGFFAKPAIRYALLAAALLLLVGLTVYVVAGIYNKGEKAGASTVTDAVQTKTITDVEKARQTKEKADIDVRNAPYSDRVDSLR